MYITDPFAAFMGMFRCDDVQEKHRVIGSGAMDEYKNDNGLLCGTSEL